MHCSASKCSQAQPPRSHPALALTVRDCHWFCFKGVSCRATAWRTAAKAVAQAMADGTEVVYARRWLVQATLRTARLAELTDEDGWKSASIVARHWDSGGSVAPSPWAFCAAGVSLRLKLRLVDDAKAIATAAEASEKAILAETLSLADTGAAMAPVGEAAFPSPAPAAKASEIAAAEVAMVRALEFDLRREAPHAALSLLCRRAQPPLSRQESQVALQLLNALGSCLDGAFSERPAALAACAAYVSCVLSGRDAPTSLLALEKVPADEAATVAAALAAGAREVLDPRRALRCLRRTQAAELAARRVEGSVGTVEAGSAAAAAGSNG